MFGKSVPTYGLADLDCFFVECERLHRPELRGRAVVIGGRPEGRGVVAAASYEARRYGLHSAMPMAEAYRVARGKPVIFLHSGLFGRYGDYSRRVQEVLAAAVPAFRPRSIDEFEFDLTGCERWLQFSSGGLLPFAQGLREDVRRRVGLPLSIGLGHSRIIAKMASRHAKPSNVFIVRPEEAREFLAPHDIQAVPGIGPATAPRLRARGIATVADLLALPRNVVRRSFDLSLERVIAELTDFDDPHVPQDPVDPRPRAAKSIGHETTFPRDTGDLTYIERKLWGLTEESCYRLRQGGYCARQVTVRIRYGDFRTVSRTAPLDSPTDSDYTVFEAAWHLFLELDQGRPQLIRLVGVRLERLVFGAGQGRLFAEPRMLQDERLFIAVDCIRDRFGKGAISVGRSIWTPRRDDRTDGSLLTSFLPVKGVSDAAPG